MVAISDAKGYHCCSTHHFRVVFFERKITSLWGTELVNSQSSTRFRSQLQSISFWDKFVTSLMLLQFVHSHLVLR